MKDGKEKQNSEGRRAEPLLFVTHSAPRNLTSNELAGEWGKQSRDDPVGRVSYTLHFTGRTFWSASTHGARPPKEEVREGVRGGAKGIQRGQEMLRAIYLSSEMLEIARR